MMSIGEKIRHFRALKGFSQESMAEMLSLSVKAYANIERGVSDANLTRLEEIAKLLDTTLIELLIFGEKSVCYVYRTKEGTKINEFIISPSILDDCQEVVSKASLLSVENENLRKEIAYLKEIINLMKKDN